jgi:hypothetical protein
MVLHETESNKAILPELSKVKLLDKGCCRNCVYSGNRRAELKNPNRPIGSLLLLGQTGIWKNAV